MSLPPIVMPGRVRRRRGDAARVPANASGVRVGTSQVAMGEDAVDVPQAGQRGGLEDRDLACP